MPRSAPGAGARPARRAAASPNAGASVAWPVVPDDALVLEAPAFGRIALFATSPGATLATPKQVVRAPGGTFAVENRTPSALRARVLAAVTARGGGSLAADLVQRIGVLQPNKTFAVWDPPASLDVTPLREPAVDLRDHPELAAGFDAMAVFLLGQVDEPGLLAAARAFYDFPAADARGVGWMWGHPGADIVGGRADTDDADEERYRSDRDRFEQRDGRWFASVAAPHAGLVGVALGGISGVTVLRRLGAEAAELDLPPCALPGSLRVLATPEPDLAVNPRMHEATVVGGDPGWEVVEAAQRARFFADSRAGWSYDHRDPHKWSDLFHPHLGRAEAPLLVRPAYRAASPAVEVAALRAGVPALADADATLPVLRFAAGAVHPVPMLHGVAAEALVLVPTDAAGRTTGPALASVEFPLLPPWADPGLESAAGSVGGDWALDCRDAVAAAVEAVEVGAGRPPARLFVGTLAGLADQVGDAPFLLSVLRLGQAGPLPLTDYGAEAPAGERQFAWPWAQPWPEVVLDVPAYQDALRVALLAEAGGETFHPTARLAERLAATAREVGRTMDRAVAEARALHAPPTLLRALQAPADALVAALRSATAGRLGDPDGARQLLHAALASLDATAAEAAGGPSDPGMADGALPPSTS